MHVALITPAAAWWATSVWQASTAQKLKPCASRPTRSGRRSVFCTGSGLGGQCGRDPGSRAREGDGHDQEELIRALTSAGTTKRATSARSSATSLPGVTSSETITRTTQRATSGSSATVRPSASITGDDWASSAVAAASPPANQADSAGRLPHPSHCREDRGDQLLLRVADPGRVGGHETADAPGLAMDVCHVQLVTVREVPVEGGAGAARGLGDVAHRDGADAVLGEQPAGGVEDLLGRQLRAVLGEPGCSSGVPAALYGGGAQRGRRRTSWGGFHVSTNGTVRGRRT